MGLWVKVDKEGNWWTGDEDLSVEDVSDGVSRSFLTG